MSSDSGFAYRLSMLRATVAAWPGPARGMLLMLTATIVLTGMHAIVRYVAQELHPFEIAFFRNVFGLLAVMPLLLQAGLHALRSPQPELHIIRGCLGGTAMMTWFYGLSVVPIAQATALSFMAVIFASVGALFFLGEKMGARRWSAVACGFIGAMLILRPGFESVSRGTVVVLVSSVCWGLATVAVKRLGRTDSAVTIVAWMAIMLTVVSFPLALWVWEWPSIRQLGWLAALGSMATFGQLAMTQALKLAETTSILPLDFTRLVWAAVLGFLAFGEVPDRWVWLGGAVIVGSATYLTLREAQIARGRRNTWRAGEES